MKKNFYITTTLPYVNADPHIGFALEIIQADAVARYQRLLGKEVIFNTGTDEHGLKIYRKALETKEDPLDYCNRYAARFDALKQVLNLSYTNFIRTTDIPHMAAAQEFWRLCQNNGDIYKKNYKVKYCVGCELEKTDSELVDDKCPIHQNLSIELIEEENYFFKFSKFQKPLLKFYKKNPSFVVPENRLHEIKNFVEKGLEDFSISRLKSKMPWGVPVPSDEDQVMYVWFDALINYISTLGWPNDEKNFKKHWPGVQVAGKDNLRQQSAMWQAMLMSAGLPNSKQIMIHGFISNAGQKMSKSLGNVVNPLELVNKYGTDAVRYYLLKYVQPFEDSDFSIESFEEVYNADLANGIGNLVSRVSNLVEKNFDGKIAIGNDREFNLTAVSENIEDYQFNVALQIIQLAISELDVFIDTEAPWKIVKSDKDKAMRILSRLVDRILLLSEQLKPFLPETADKIEKIFTARKINKPAESLFPRL